MPPKGWFAYVIASGETAMVGNTDHPNLQIQVHYGENNERHEFQPDATEQARWARRIANALKAQDQEVASA